jgi:hypothetical protein
MNRVFARWRCRRGHHDLEPLRGPGILNVGVCKWCGVISSLKPGEWSYTCVVTTTSQGGHDERLR